MHLTEGVNMNGSEIIHVNIGGTVYTTTRATLCRYPDSMLGAMFRGDIPSRLDHNGHYFIDRDGETFKYILNFLRSTKLSLPNDFKEYDLLLCEANFYQIRPLIELILHMQEESSRNKSHSHYLEIIEVRIGTTATMPSKNSRVKTIMIGRKDVILSLPTQLIGEEAIERLVMANKMDFVELELNSSNIRLRLAETLKNSNWELLESNLSSSSSTSNGSGTAANITIEQTYRDRWMLNLPKIKKFVTYMLIHFFFFISADGHQKNLVVVDPIGELKIILTCILLNVLFQVIIEFPHWKYVIMKPRNTVFKH